MAYRIDSNEHDRWVNKIAKIRFPFPDSQHPAWITYVNHPDKTMGVLDGKGESIYPDIVVVDGYNNKAIMCGEVETEESVTKEEAEQWREYSDVIQPFYLYVPTSSGNEAKYHARMSGAKIEGFRKYYTDLLGNTIIEEY